MVHIKCYTPTEQSCDLSSYKGSAARLDAPTSGSHELIAKIGHGKLERVPCSAARRKEIMRTTLFVDGNAVVKRPDLQMRPTTKAWVSAPSVCYLTSKEHTDITGCPCILIAVARFRDQSFMPVESCSIESMTKQGTEPELLLYDHPPPTVRPGILYLISTVSHCFRAKT